MKLSADVRFWSKVDKSGGPDTCWEWTATKTKKGYGQFGVGGKLVYAHRFAYELEHGPIPNGLCVCHGCDNPGCVNPAHTFLGTNSDNSADMVAKGRQAKGDKCAVRGERHGRAKLTAAQVEEIRALYSAGEGSLYKLGNRFGVNKSTIHYVVRGKSWKECGDGQ